MTDTELDTLVDGLNQYGKAAKNPGIIADYSEELALKSATAIIILRQQLAEAHETWPLWAAQIKGKLESYGVDPGYEWNVAEQFENWLDEAVEIETAAANARADRAEAALAAQIEADAGIADDYVKMRERQIADEKAKAAHYVNVPQLMRWGAGKIQSENIAAAIRAQPHDRTALDRALESAREKALREAADAYFIPKFCIEADRGRVEAFHAFRAAILALIDHTEPAKGGE